MIRLLFNAWRRARADHHDRRAGALGAATLSAQLERRWDEAARHLRAMHEAQARRDALLRAAGVTCCNHDCDQGRRCPRRIPR